MFYPFNVSLLSVHYGSAKSVQRAKLTFLSLCFLAGKVRKRKNVPSCSFGCKARRLKGRSEAGLGLCSQKCSRTGSLEGERKEKGLTS